MGNHDYRFTSHWRVRGTVDEVTEAFRTAENLQRWWPAVYLRARTVDPGDPDGLGYTSELHSKGWLPYTLNWQSKVVETRHPHGFRLATTGDFAGEGEWKFTQDGEWVSLDYDWRIRTEKPLLRYGSFFMKPIYGLNHRWAMNVGEKSLQLELDRRRAKTQAEREAIPLPPGPSKIHPVWGLLALVLAAAGLAVAFQRSRKDAG